MSQWLSTSPTAKYFTSPTQRNFPPSRSTILHRFSIDPVSLRTGKIGLANIRILRLRAEFQQVEHHDRFGRMNLSERLNLLCG